ncbi:hypothetical protein C8A05DRAFT_36263 [Staphylotrichum tortipilum]|uniref:WSC domain-containing protein n=1 Tax=Staphylotrichum tortipilum TaxID=2831512 RepID=A0AAN6RRG5_9PEZI|nr:hypothetical protein C8A05DRAFT_36263 [Staphylotrichum longicolle]
MKSTTVFAVALIAAAEAFPESIGALRAVKWTRERIEARYVKGKQTPITPAMLNGPTSQGCYKSSGSLKYISSPQYNTIGSCGKDTCLQAGYAVGGTMGGNQCFCGNTYPPKSDLVDDSKCDVGCTGYGEVACGGLDYWSIYNTGKTLSVKYDGDESTSKSSSSTSETTSSTTAPEKTMIVTQTPTETASNPGGGTNVAGIVAGVVVGVVVVACAAGGGFLFMRRKRNKEIEEEHRRNAAVNAFIGKPPGSSAGSMTDSRLDPVMAQRRMSDGSIADNQDYSRRILRVTNA